MRIANVITVIALCVAAPSHAQEVVRDVFARDAALRREAGIERLALDLELGGRGAERRVVRWLERNPGAAPEQRRTGWLGLCAARFRERRYDAAIAACEQGDALTPGSATSMIRLLQAMRVAPPTSWSVRGLVAPLSNRRIAISHGGESVEALIDTGAEIAIVSESVARRLGGRRLEGGGTLETTTTPISGQLVLFETLEVVSAELRNVVAMVLPDEQMAYTEESFVLDLSSLIVLGRAAYLDHGARIALGDAAPRARGAWTPLYWDQSGVGFAADFAGGRRAVHFDTGSSRTYLYPIALSALSPQEQATRASITRRIGGIGGERVEDASKFRDVTMRVANRAWRFAEVEMAENDEDEVSARIGFGLVERYRTVVLDFERMRMSLEE